MDCELKKQKGKDNSYTMTFKGMTRGMLLAMKTAMDNHNTAVGNDVRDFLVYAMQNIDDPQVKDLLNKGFA